MEVFNIDKNIFTYQEAPMVCKALGAELATYDQVLNAYKKGANWCNYGWTGEQMAVYPIQKDYYDDIQNGPKSNRDDCGKPGINGGYFADTSLKFGVNCYGIRPKPDPDRIVYSDDPRYSVSPGVQKHNTYDRQKLRELGIGLTPFNDHKWSCFSNKDSQYIPKSPNVPAAIPDDLKPSDEDPLLGGCQGTRYGCCHDGHTPKSDSKGSNCSSKKCDPRDLIVSEEVL